MSFDNILGQDRPKKNLKKSLQSGRIPNSYLFYGQDSVGKKLTAHELSKALNCNTLGPIDSCDKCSSCLKIEKGIHPDVHILEPQIPPGARQAVIKIDAIRKLQKKLMYLPYDGQTKIVIINDAESMNLQAANSFLKTLEEPPSKTLIILIASNPYQLLPTIVSRCQGIRFHPLPVEAIKKIVSKHLLIETGENQLEEVEIRSQRSMGRVALALDENLIGPSGHREELINLITEVSFKRMDITFRWTKEQGKQVDKIQLILDELINILRDTALIKICKESNYIFNKDLMPQLRILAQQKSISSLLILFDAVQNTKAALKSNANTQLSLENMLISFCETA
jgi:DNA polymerase III subunit delta'